ncbi:MAG: hypothetical protein U0W24_26605 [Bacteroidales bacterium]
MQKTNPYPGLRPFTEKESIFFKGRDLHIRQIIKQLEKNKIVVITGASGDGKSSLVYAGVIPNARAGFFKAEYNNWLICDFRPERTPLSNLTKSLSENFKIAPEKIADELNLGFSSLIRIYKNSQYYIDRKSERWKSASAAEQKKMKAGGANLFILADQFEEFFTNPENYSGGVPSEDAYLTVNLLLESAGLAINENLPVYIVFTMRSDYISQSVSYKGLPEYIGYSQFFVPRLQRNELQQVIEDPARLAGGSISKRLTETLINELRDGFDQLPIIQYSLSQLWKVASNGQDEMDLVHLVKLAGLPTRYLSHDDKEKFEKWVNEQEAFKQKYFQNTSLSNVLNTHANILYETAFLYFEELVEWASHDITEEDARYIIKTAFQSLTRIDQGRAVRNRVTLREITDIINRPEIPYEVVCGVLNIFRLPGNNFIRPYIDPNDLESEYLSANTVLDITHEALIRNWEVLTYWEIEEKENFNNYQDFKIQLDRWKANHKSDEFLLSLGPLAHFEKWYDKHRPNKYWIAKYDNTLEPKEVKLARAEEIAVEVKEYLHKSRVYIIKAEQAKRRRRTALGIASLLIIIILAGITFWAMRERFSAIEQRKIAEIKTKQAEEQKQLAQNEKNKAVSATELARQEKMNAERSAREALWAKAQSDSARKYAVFLQLLAQEQSTIAKQEAERARKEKERADKEKILAEKAKNQAEVATDSTKTLNYLTLARNLALKAQNSYEDPQVNLLLAFQAYKFNKQYGGIERNPDIYNALRFALSVNGSSNIIEIKNKKIISFYVQRQVLILHTIDNEIIYYNVKNHEVESKQLLYKTKIPVNTSYFLTDDYLVIGFEDKTQVLYVISSNAKFELKGHTELIRAADKNPVADEFATAGRDQKINIWKLENKNQQPLKSFKAKARINAIRYTADGKNIIAAANDGSIAIWNIESGKESLLDKKEGVRALSIGQNAKRDIMAVGFENGSIIVFYPKENFNKKDYLLSNTGIKALDFSSNGSLLSISKENKRVDINNTREMDVNTIHIMDHDVKVYNLLFGKNDRLYGLCEDNTIRFWEKDNKTYMESVKALIKRNLSESEWNIYIGDNVKYEKVK